MLVTLCLIILPMLLSGQTIIRMKEDGGVYKIPCTINGIKASFIFDTGASVVSLSKDLANLLESKKVLSKEDYLGNTKTTIADGSQVGVEVVTLKDFEVGGIHLKDVIATVKEGQNVPLLMGQTAIQKLGRISIDKDKLIIHHHSALLTPEKIKSIRTDIDRYYSDRQYEMVTQKLYQLMEGSTIDCYDYYRLIVALYHTQQFPEVIDIGKEWEIAQINKDEYESEGILWAMAHTYLTLGNYKEAIGYFQRTLKMCPTHPKGGTLAEIAACYYNLNNKVQTESFIKQAIDSQYAYLSIIEPTSLSNVIANEVYDDNLGYAYWMYALYEDTFNNDSFQRDYYFRLSAKCNYKPARDYCNKNQIDYLK